MSTKHAAQRHKREDQRPLVLLAIALLILSLHLAGGYRRQHDNCQPEPDQFRYIWLKGGTLAEGLYRAESPLDLAKLYRRAGLALPAAARLKPLPVSPLTTVMLENGAEPNINGTHPQTAVLFCKQIPVNRADLEVLTTVSGIGPGLAKRIIELRNQRGGFADVKELLAVNGIGPKKVEMLKNAFSFVD